MQGVDMVMHSVTKFVGVHNDLVAGVVVGSSRHIELASKIAGHWGLCVALFDSWLSTCGICTLQVSESTTDL
jgi:cystathionine gamma-synthase